MKKLELNQMENLEGGRRFWGTEQQNAGTCSGGFVEFVDVYYVFGIGVSTSSPYISNVKCEVVPNP